LVDLIVQACSHPWSKMASNKAKALCSLLAAPTGKVASKTKEACEKIVTAL